MKEKDKPKDGDLITTTDPEGRTWSWVYSDCDYFSNTQQNIQEESFRFGILDMSNGEFTLINDKDEK